MNPRYYHSSDLPWTMLEEDEGRFRRILRRIAIVFVVLAVLVPFLPLPRIEREKAEALPPRFAKLLMERQQPKPPAVKAPEAARKPDKPKKPEEVQKRAERAREKASHSGLLALKDELADLRQAPVTSSLRTEARVGAPAAEAAPAPERALITSNVAGGSGGINTAKLSRDTGGAGLAGRATTQVQSPVGGDASGRVRRGSSGKVGRATEEIMLVLHRNKSAIDAIYHRALRADPTLQGKILLKLTIAPSGHVLKCEILSSEVNAPELERKLVARVSQFDFGAKDADTAVVTVPLNLVPS